MPEQLRVVKTMEELDVILEEVDAAGAVSDDELRRVFKTITMEFPLELPSDPYSDEYYKKQFELYEYLAEKPYHTENEVSLFDVESAASRPFPFYTGSPKTVGEHLIAIGHLIRTIDLPEKRLPWLAISNGLNKKSILILAMPGHIKIFTNSQCALGMDGDAVAFISFDGEIKHCVLSIKFQIFDFQMARL